MNILIINPILYACEGWNIPQVKSIKDTMIYVEASKLCGVVTLLDAY